MAFNVDNIRILPTMYYFRFVLVVFDKSVIPK